MIGYKGSTTRNASAFRAPQFTSLNVTNGILCNTSSNSTTLDHTKLFIKTGLCSVGELILLINLMKFRAKFLFFYHGN